MKKLGVLLLAAVLSLSLLAACGEETFTVTFDSNGGGSVAAQTVESGKKAVKPQDPVYEEEGGGAKRFVDWYKDEALTQRFDFETETVTKDLKLYAKWEDAEPVSYTVTFDSGGGSVVAPAVVEEGKTVTKPTDPTKTGHTFAGWFTEAACTTEYNFNNAVTANATLYAKWTTNQYTVTFDSKGGSAVAPATVDYNGKVTKPADPTKTGHTFAGWFTEAACTTEYNFNNAVTANATLYAKWTINQYTVTFDSKGGSAVAPATVDYNGKVTKPTDPTKTGSTFAGWFTDSACTTEYNFNTAVTANATLYAKWTINQYTVTFDSKGGSAVAPATVDYNGKVTKPADPTKTGSTFAGWFTDEDCTTEYSFDTAVTANATLYAKWTINQYTVTFDSKGGSAVASATVDYNGKVTKPADPTKTGYTFAGWFTDEDCTKEYSFETAVTANVTLYAKWTVNQFTVTFDSKGGSAVASATVDYNGKVTKPADPTKTGYTFAGWFTDEDCTKEYSFETAVTANVTLYAKWTVNQYTLTFESNGGSEVASVTVDYNGKVEMPADPTKTGNTFVGWFTESGKKYSFASPVVENLTLYAKWEPMKIKVTIEMGDQFGTDYRDVVYGEAIPEKEIPIPPDSKEFRFIGWFTELKGGELFDFTQPITEQVTIYAHWEEITYTVEMYLFKEDAEPWKTVTYSPLEGFDSGLYSPKLFGYDFYDWLDVNGNPVKNLWNEDARLYARLEIRRFFVQWPSEVVGMENEFVYKTEVRFTVNSQEGQTVKQVLANGQPCEYDESTGEYFFTVAGETVISILYEGDETFTVDFVVDGTVLKTITLKAGDYLGPDNFPQVPEKPGYEGMWNPQSIDGISENMTVTAEYRQVDFAVTFMAGGNELFTLKAEHGFLTLTQNQRAVLESYLWYLDEEGTQRIDPIGYIFPEDCTLYGKEPAKSFTVTFVFNNGTEQSETLVFEYGKPQQLPIPQFENMHLIGWQAPDGRRFQSSEEVSRLGEDMTLTAVWEEMRYQLVFSWEDIEGELGGEYPIDTELSFTVRNPENVVAVKVNGKEITANEKGVYTFVLSGDTFLTVERSGEQYVSLRFVTEEGGILREVMLRPGQSIESAYDKLNLEQMFERAGYNVRFMLDGNDWWQGMPVEMDTDVTVVYVKESSVITLITEEGEKQVTIASYQRLYELVDNQWFEGFDWYLDAEFTVSAGDTMEIINRLFNDDTTYYGKRLKQEFNVTFDPNCEGLEPQTVLVKRNGGFDLPEFIREGYRLLGWSLSTEDTGNYLDEWEIPRLGDDTTLYAHWMLIPDYSGNPILGKWVYGDEQSHFVVLEFYADGTLKYTQDGGEMSGFYSFDEATKTYFARLDGSEVMEFTIEGNTITLGDVPLSRLEEGTVIVYLDLMGQSMGLLAQIGQPLVLPEESNNFLWTVGRFGEVWDFSQPLTAEMAVDDVIRFYGFSKDAPSFSLTLVDGDSSATYDVRYESTDQYLDISMPKGTGEGFLFWHNDDYTLVSAYGSLGISASKLPEGGVTLSAAYDVKEKDFSALAGMWVHPDGFGIRITADGSVELMQDSVVQEIMPLFRLNDDGWYAMEYETGVVYLAIDASKAAEGTIRVSTEPGNMETFTKETV